MTQSGGFIPFEFGYYLPRRVRHVHVLGLGRALLGLRQGRTLYFTGSGPEKF